MFPYYQPYFNFQQTFYGSVNPYTMAPFAFQETLMAPEYMVDQKLI